jgi:hypothetical protein
MGKLVTLVVLAFALAVGSSILTLMVEHSHLGPQRVATVTSLPR